MIVPGATALTLLVLAAAIHTVVAVGALHRVLAGLAILQVALGAAAAIVRGDGVVAGVILKGTKSENAGWLTIVIGWGIAVTLAIYAVGRFSGAHLNPAITVALWAAGDFDAGLVVVP